MYRGRVNERSEGTYDVLAFAFASFITGVSFLLRLDGGCGLWGAATWGDRGEMEDSEFSVTTRRHPPGNKTRYSAYFDVSGRPL